MQVIRRNRAAVSSPVRNIYAWTLSPQQILIRCINSVMTESEKGRTREREGNSMLSNKTEECRLLWCPPRPGGALNKETERDNCHRQRYRILAFLEYASIYLFLNSSITSRLDACTGYCCCRCCCYHTC